MNSSGPVTPTTLGLGQLFFRFLRFGCLAFGGPVAQIAMIRQALVEEERWISPSRFNRLLAVMQVLPGPEAHELCVHLGMVARGRIGGVLAGLGFMLPGLVLMLAAAWSYHRWVGTIDGLSGLFLGVQIVVLAIIARAVQRIGGHILENRPLWLIAALSLAATIAGVPFWIPLVAGGAAYAADERRWAWPLVLIAAVAAAWMVHGMDGARPTQAPSTATTLALFIAGLKGGLLTFGGAYTAIPYVRADTVQRGWLSDAAFLDGVAVANILPAPLVIFATFTGYVAGGMAGALAITAGMFLPAFAFSLVFFERLESLVDNPALHRWLAGVAAAVVGVIAATLIDLGLTVAGRTSQPVPAILLFGIALAIVWRIKGRWVAPLLIAGGAAAGSLVAL
ncbi:chromate efflux transporter [Sphingomonas sp. BGYR3]|uniref:chromate efflux transporter n=1 Tax=Sphingomonas sp. BGYR3 TaxID=2975483 RepID=UPI0021A4C755|nr:chromate efflux transporter [Sphingomonas sp. BGYR3]MDG5489528.1 chromate efflux transporter [Sphingomonas sp. BGYR3]